MSDFGTDDGRPIRVNFSGRTEGVGRSAVIPLGSIDSLGCPRRRAKASHYHGKGVAAGCDRKPRQSYP